MQVSPTFTNNASSEIGSCCLRRQCWSGVDKDGLAARELHSLDGYCIQLISAKYCTGGYIMDQVGIVIYTCGN